MSPKPGRPFEEKSKQGRFEIRTSEDESKILQSCCELTGKSRAEIVRMGIEAVYKQLKSNQNADEYDDQDEPVLMVNVSCPNCDKNHRINVNEYEVDRQSYNRKMGYEVEYTIESECFECRYCNTEFKFSGSVWEYPEGVITHKEIKVFR